MTSCPDAAPTLTALLDGFPFNGSYFRQYARQLLHVLCRSHNAVAHKLWGFSSHLSRRASHTCQQSCTCFMPKHLLLEVRGSSIGRTWRLCGHHASTEKAQQLPQSRGTDSVSRSNRNANRRVTHKREQRMSCTLHMQMLYFRKD